MGFIDRVQRGWNAFRNRDPTAEYNYQGIQSSYRPDRVKMIRGTEQSIVAPIYNRIAIDFASISLVHARLGENDKFIGSMDSGLNNCLTLSANKDQTARAFKQDMVLTLFSEGCIAVIPVDTTINPMVSNSYDILSLRVGKIITWFPDYVKVRVYNDRVGQTEDIMLPKSSVAIIENPHYAVMNGSNSIVPRLIRTLNLSDTIDEQNGSGKLDLIIQLPYAIKSEARRAMAENRRQDMESQLSGSKYGIAYTDATEHITQLNRGVENNLNQRVEYLTKMLYAQLGITEEIMNGTADDKVMQNYYSRTIEPIIDAVIEEFKRKFLTKTARSQGQSIVFFRDPFKLVPVTALADIADKFTRNEILSSNEIRQIVGYKPVNDSKADELRNKNINAGEDQEFASTSYGDDYTEGE